VEHSGKPVQSVTLFNHFKLNGQAFGPAFLLPRM
jgi:hypothetical protein